MFSSLQSTRAPQSRGVSVNCLSFGAETGSPSRYTVLSLAFPSLYIPPRFFSNDKKDQQNKSNEILMQGSLYKFTRLGFFMKSKYFILVRYSPQE